MPDRPSVPPAWRLFLAACALLSGEFAGFAVPAASPCWPLAAFLLVVVLLAAYGWSVRRAAAPLLFLLGVVLAFRTEARLAALLAANAERAETHADLTLRVEGPVCRRPRRDGGWNVDFPSHAGPLPLKVVLPVPDGAPVPAPGELWLAGGWISRREARTGRYARRTLWVRTPADARRVGGDTGPGPVSGWIRIGDALARVLGAGLDWAPELADLNRAILLGRREGISPARHRTFADAGTIHVFAISGLHVMVVAWALGGALARIGVSRRGRGLLCLPPLWSYVFLTGAHPSAMRAALMASFHLLAIAADRRPDALVSWSATALAVYALHPERVYDIGCTFSFAVMLGIVFWMRCSRDALPSAASDGFLAGQLRDLGVSAAAWAAGVPIAAHVFGRITPGGLLANYIVVRCAGPLVKCGAGSIAAGAFCLPLAAVLNNAAAAFTWTMVFVSERVAALPFSSFDVVPWNGAQCAAWYAGCAVPLLVLRRLGHGGGPARGRWWT